MDAAETCVPGSFGCIIPSLAWLEGARARPQSPLPAKRKLDQLGIARRTFSCWYERCLDGSPEAVEDRPSTPSRVSTRIGDGIQTQA